MTKKTTDKVIIGILLTQQEKVALKALADKNCRKLTDQARLYIREGLERDGKEV